MSILFNASLLLSFGIFLVPKRMKYAVTLALQLLLVVSSGAWALEALLNADRVTVPLGISTWSGEIIMTIDKLSAFFILLLDFVCLAGVLYAGGYLKSAIHKKRAVIISLHFFSLLWLNASMILVTAMGDGLSFLLAWELMSLTSFILVIFEGHKETTLRTGINYLLQMHLSFALIMFGFLLVKDASGEMSFQALGPYFATHSNTLVFVVFFAGFGIKAGFIPLHTWLPKAHPAAPSHVSGIMSGVMIKMGIYGILRVTSFLSADQELIGSIVLGVGIVSGLVGVILAIMQHDLKRLLAYHSVENIGIIGIGIGLSILGMANHDPVLAVLGMSGALLHCVNHALFKSLLFFTTGNIHHTAGTVKMDELGGIVHHARATSVAFLIGAIAISGIPPFNGFISEFFIYSGIVANFTHATFAMSLAGLCSLIGLVLIGGLCVYCFTKAFGLTFLGSRRAVHPVNYHSPTPMMMIPLVILGAAITLIGFFPILVIQPLASALTVFSNLELQSPALFATQASLQAIGLTNIVLVGILVVVYGLRAWQQARVTRAAAPTWGCGYEAVDFRHQYTPTSYANSLVEVVEPAVVFHKEMPPIGQGEIFPDKRTFRTHASDRVEKSVVMTIIDLLIRFLPLAGRAQTGYIHHYLLYPVVFMIVIVLLTHFKYI